MEDHIKSTHTALDQLVDISSRFKHAETSMATSTEQLKNASNEVKLFFMVKNPITNTTQS
jgi:hypothetical protein